MHENPASMIKLMQWRFRYLDFKAIIWVKLPIMHLNSMFSIDTQCWVNAHSDYLDRCFIVC